MAESCENFVSILILLPGCGSVNNEDKKEWTNQDEHELSENISDCMGNAGNDR